MGVRRNGEDDLGAQGGIKSVRSLERGLSILSCFDAHHTSLDLPGFVERTKLPKATVHRLVKTLEAQGFLSFDPASGKYRGGIALIRTAHFAISRPELVRVARPHIERLAAITGETVDLGVFTEEGVLLVDQVPTSRPFKPAIAVGRIFTNNANAAVKLAAAFGSADIRSRLLAQPPERRTPYTIVDPVQLTAEIEKVAAEGYSCDLQESDLGIIAVSAPIRDFTGKMMACMAVVCPPERFGPDEKERYARALKDTALAISRELGYQESRSDN